MDRRIDPSLPRSRAAADTEFRSLIHQHRYDDHVAPINRLVDDLSSGADGRWAPYVAPTYGGVRARVLLHLQDPGPATDRERGSGFLCHQNDDPSAQLLAESLDNAGLDASSVITWNAYPWFRTDQRAGPLASQIVDGLDPLHRLLQLLPELRAILLMGAKAQDSWRRYEARHPVLTAVPARSTLHTSRRGITNGGQHSRGEGIERLRADLRWARDLAT